MKLNHFTNAIIVASLMAHSAHAISLVDSVGFGNTTGSTAGTRAVTSTEYGTFNANGADKLIVTVGGEGLNNGSDSDNTVTSITYGGVALNEAVQRNQSGRTTSIWYLDNVSVTGDFLITFAENQSGLGFSALAFSGTAAGGPLQTAQTSQNSGTAGSIADMTMTTLSAGELVVASFARNNADTAGVGVADPLTEIYYETNTDGSSAASGYGFTDGSGTVTPQIYNLTNGAGSLVGATFAAVPEPSAFALLAGCFGFAWVMLRRR